jgi:hypothetical protein
MADQTEEENVAAALRALVTPGQTRKRMQQRERVVSGMLRHCDEHHSSNFWLEFQEGTRVCV